MKEYSLITLWLFVCTVACQKSRSFNSVFLDAVTEGAKLYFSKNPVLDETGFNVVDIDDYYSATDLFKRVYGETASTSRFVAALLDFQFSLPRSTSFSDVQQLILVGEYQDARKTFAAHARKRIAELIDDDDNIKSSDEEHAISKITHLFASIYNLVGDRRFASFLSLRVGSSLSFVMDTTGSMSDEIEAVKLRVFDIINSTRGTNKAPLNYVLMPFNDPEYGPVTKTEDANEFIESVNALTASGGKDPPELVLHGILEAALNSEFRSTLYVFTDNEAKDIELQNHVISVCLQKEISVIFLLTRDIDRRKRRDLLEGRSLYDYIVEKTGGFVIIIEKDEIKSATKIMEHTTENLVLLKTVRDVESGEIFVHVDSFVEYLSVIITGLFEYVSFNTTAAGILHVRVYPISRALYANIGIANSTRLSAGRYSVLFNDSYPNKYTASVMAKTNLAFHPLLSQKKRGKDEYETSQTLQASKDTIAEITISGDAETIDFKTFMLLSHNEEVLIEKNLTKNSFRKYYIQEPFQLPNQTMFVKITGLKDDKEVVERMSQNVIHPIVSKSYFMLISDKSMEPGDNDEMTVYFLNSEDDDEFIIHVSDTKGFVTMDETKFTLEKRGYKRITLKITIPDDVEQGVLSKAILTATGVKNNDFVLSEFVVRVKDEEEERCTSPESPVGGIVQCDGTYEGASCNLTCDEEYVLKGNDLMYCEGETWDLELGTCVRMGSKECSVEGGGHYTTFDEFNFDFEGTCLYQLLHVKPESELEKISVVTENSLLEDSEKIAWFKNGIISVYNTTIQIKRKKRVLIDGIQVTLPALLEDGKIYIGLDGDDLLLTTDFKFKLRYDGDFFFRLFLPASYIGKVSGMCGNYDNDNSNEMLVKGKKYTKWADFGNALEVPGGLDPICRKGEEGDEKDSCVSAGQKAIFAERCTATKSICFQNCSKSAEETPLDFKNCLFDLCGTSGVNATYENALDSLARKCKESGAQICNWREEYRFPKVCGRHSHYDPNANRCPDTCVDREASKRCSKKPRAEACVCDEGYVRSGTECITIEECGCSRDGRYYKDFDEVLNSNCTENCICSDGMMICEETSCAKGQECRISKAAKYACKNKRTDHCAVIGQTWIRTLDGLYYDFAGKCRYKMLESERSLVDDPSKHIVVSTQFDYMKDSSYPYVESVHIEAGAYKAQLGPGLVFSVEVDGVMKEFTDKKEFLFDEDFGSVKKIGFAVKLETKHGVSIRLDERSMYIRAPSYYMRKVSGLCGNYTGFHKDDFGDADPKKSDVTSTYRISPETCKEDLKKKQKRCSTRDAAKWKRNSRRTGGTDCGKLESKKLSIFMKICKTLVSDYVKICLADSCTSRGDENAVKKVISALGQHCRADNKTIGCTWERDYEITHECPENMHYDQCASPCTESCQSPAASASCSSEDIEGRCVCDRDFLFDDGKCIQKSKCGCTLSDGTYIGQEVSKMQPNCAYKETCFGPNDINRMDDPCGEKYVCNKGSGDGESVCTLKENLQEKGYALLFGGPHFKTLDNKHFDFTGECCYLFMGYTRAMEMKEVPGFRVNIVKRVMKEKESTSTSKTIIIELMKEDSTKIIMKVMEYNVMIDDVKYSVGSRYKNILISIRSGLLAINFDFGLHVLFNGKDWIKVEIPGNFKGKIFGLAGNYNDNPDDDLMIDGIATSPESWGEHWVTENCSAKKCKKSIPSIHKSCRLKDHFKRRSECGILTDSEGPFGSCNDEISPKPYIQSCLYDVCDKTESIADAENAISTYAIGCKNKGIRVGEWRVVFSMPMYCPPNSHYENCTSPCQPACGMKNDDEKCRSEFCEEGCVCDDGYILSNAKCVLRSECGCYDEKGVYIEHGSTLMNDDCTSSCTCLSGEFSCERYSCLDDQLCDVKDGERNCYFKDQCHYDNGGCSDVCKWENDIVSCSCSPGRILLKDEKTCVEVSSGGTDNCGTWFNTWKNEFLDWREDYLMELREFRKETRVPYKWTRWFDTDDPSGEGDEETLAYISREYSEVCKSPIAAEAMMVDGRNAGAVAAIFTVDAENGLICKNSEQALTSGFKCPDFKVRFLC